MRQYFRPRPRFGKREHPYDIGRPFSWWKSHYDRHFLNALYKLDENEFEAFYRYHLDFFTDSNSGAEEDEYYHHVHDIAADELTVLVREGKHASRNRHERSNRQKIHLRKFIGYLDGIDRWNTGKTKDEIILAKEEEVRNLKDQMEMLKTELRAARKLETDDYINLPKDQLLTFLDLCLQLQEAKLPDGRELLFSQTQIVWAKLICKYFREDNAPISLDTVRRYFPGDRRNPGSKYAAIPAKKKMFLIVEAKKRSQ
ncbi:MULTISPECIES: hypothetical protein [Sphingobacterium]|uniref:hypothetical protein n=1 Tax=Sphingobacterium TaxID=28453 RepID=UPI0021A4E5E3|nr:MULTISPECIES: hypothetical protein [Sphingobacterium]MCT1524871.1 hypothetical protein [Sphingobacterium hotanense]